jgi:hypothetical protein
MEELLDFLDERLSSGKEDGNVLLKRRVSSALARELVEFMSEQQKADLDIIDSALQANEAVIDEELLPRIWGRIDRNAGSDKKSDCIDRIIVSYAGRSGGLTVELAEYLVSWGECGGLNRKTMSEIFEREL